MFKKLGLISLVFCMLLAGCYNDDLLKQDIADLQARVARLETLCNQLNTNIGSLQTIVSALENKDYITSINPIRDGDVIIGYTLNFTKSGEVKIYHGEKGDKGDKGEKGDHGQKGDKGDSGAAGKNGETPIIGVKLDADGVYYWTLNGEWLLDSSGNKVRATGSDGKDGKDGTNGTNGVTPQLKIEEGYWYVSYDNGSTWNKLGAAQSDQGDSMFSAVTFDSNFVYVTLAEGGTFLTIPRYAPVSISFDVENDETTIFAGETITINYTIEGATNQTKITASSDGNYSVKVIRTDNEKGTLKVKCPYPYVDGFINVMVDNGFGYTTFKTINFKERRTVFGQGLEYRIAANGGQVEIPFVTNFDYSVSLGAEGAGWISVVETKADRDAKITLSIGANTQSRSRVGRVYLHPLSGDGAFYLDLIILQASDVIPNYNDIICYTKSDGALIFDGAMDFGANLIAHSYSEEKGFVFFDGPITIIGDYAFQNVQHLSSITLPNSTTSIGYGAFQNCISLTSIHIPDGVTNVGMYAFDGCTNLTTATISSSLTSISAGTFRGCGFPSITIPNSVTSVGANAFEQCVYLESVTFPNGVTTIGDNALRGCKSLTSVSIPSSTTIIGMGAFGGCTSLTSIVIPDSVTAMGGGVLAGCVKLTSATLSNSMTYIPGDSFIGCVNLSSFTIPESATSIGDQCFAGCKKLTSVTLPNSISYIDERAFQGSGLTSITIPSSVTNICREAFQNCVDLASITVLRTTPPTGGYNMFNNTTCPIYVPADKVDVYKYTLYWSAYSDRITAILD